jgi:hypothetical protein
MVTEAVSMGHLHENSSKQISIEPVAEQMPGTLFLEYK